MADITVPYNSSLVNLLKKKETAMTIDDTAMTVDDIKILNVKSGDVLVFSTDVVLSQDQARELSERLQKKVDSLNLGVKMMLITSGLQLVAVLQGERKASHPVVNCSE